MALDNYIQIESMENARMIMAVLGVGTFLAISSALLKTVNAGMDAAWSGNVDVVGQAIVVLMLIIVAAVILGEANPL